MGTYSAAASIQPTVGQAAAAKARDSKDPKFLDGFAFSLLLQRKLVGEFVCPIDSGHGTLDKKSFIPVRSSPRCTQSTQVDVGRLRRFTGRKAYQGGHRICLHEASPTAGTKTPGVVCRSAQLCAQCCQARGCNGTELGFANWYSI